MTQSIIKNNNQNDEIFQIIKQAIRIGFLTPSIPWFWSQWLIPVKLLPNAVYQVFTEGRSLSTMLFPSVIILLLVGINFFYMYVLNEARKKFWVLLNEKKSNFKKEPIKVIFDLSKIIINVVLFGGSAFLTSKFYLFV
ncbi:MAG: hypothetical protein AAFN00_16960 [Cyanobacteria bacterium J06558_2]